MNTVTEQDNLDLAAEVNLLLRNQKLLHNKQAWIANEQAKLLERLRAITPWGIISQADSTSPEWRRTEQALFATEHATKYAATAAQYAEGAVSELENLTFILEDDLEDDGEPSTAA